MRNYLFAVIFIFTAIIQAQAQAVLQRVTGQVDIRYGPDAPWQRASAGMNLNDGMMISTGFYSEAILLADGKAVIIPALSRANIIFVLGETGETSTVVDFQPPRAASPNSFLPPPPLGFGRNERIKIKLSKEAPESHPNFNINTLDLAGFKQSSSMPRGSFIKIDLIWP
ncbi:MAG: hypothetical protein Pg6A_20460 [Termitinemataceae bacterium]|nr:MAG: hypothetical protein Pg6A_20460 [Termitinemataceae bacterium]